jgi:hypothetical protein
METGQGINSTVNEDKDPEVMLRWSDDSGKNWSNERTRKLGKIGETWRQVRFNGLGTERKKGRIFEMSITAAVPRQFNRAFGDVIQVKP